MAAVNVDSVPRPEPVSSDARPKANSFNIGTRKSKLALVQTELVVEALQKAWPHHDFQIHARDTAAGDIDKVTPFKDMPVKNLWTHELEQLLIERKLDILVHSLKDVPTQVPPSCVIGGIMAREDPRDVFVLKAGRAHCEIGNMPAGSVIGTSSIRRTAQIALRHPQLQVLDVRGNIHTRLQKLDAKDSPFDAVVIAAAGLHRLDLGHRITQYLGSDSGGMLHAVGQGAIGVETRANDHKMTTMLAEIIDKPSSLACFAERSLLRTIEGGCSAPLGVQTKWKENSFLHMTAIVVSVDGKESVEVEKQARVDSNAEAEQFGAEIAADLLKKGANRILAAIQAKKMTTTADLREGTS